MTYNECKIILLSFIKSRSTKKTTTSAILQLVEIFKIDENLMTECITKLALSGDIYIIDNEDLMLIEVGITIKLESVDKDPNIKVYNDKKTDLLYKIYKSDKESTEYIFLKKQLANLLNEGE